MIKIVTPNESKEIKNTTSEGMAIIAQIARQEGYLIGLQQAKNASPETLKSWINEARATIKELNEKFDLLIPKSEN